MEAINQAPLLFSSLTEISTQFHVEPFQTKKEKTYANNQCITQTKKKKRDVKHAGTFSSARNQASTQSFKKIIFSEYLNSTFTYWSLHFTWLTAEYRLGAVCITHVQQCQSHQCSFLRPGAQHMSHMKISKCAKWVQILCCRSNGTAFMSNESHCGECWISTLTHIPVFLLSLDNRVPRHSISFFRNLMHQIHLTSPPRDLMHWWEPDPSPQTLHLFLYEHKKNSKRQIIIMTLFNTRHDHTSYFSF